MKDSFVFYRSFYEAIKKIPNECKMEVYEAIVKYSFEESVGELSPMADAMFTLIKPTLDSSQKRYEAKINNGKMGGRPSKKTEEIKTEIKPNNNLSKTEPKPKRNLSKT